MSKEFKIPKKLIEVALPLDDINAAASREKSIRHGHPSSMHLWWARRPLAAARAVIFAQMVNDPGYQQGDGFKHGVNKEKAALKREKLFQVIRDLVKWENSNSEDVLGRAREAIRESWRETCELNKDHPQAAELFDPEKLPAFHDPFAGGGALPLEAQRLGLESHASDLNPVAVVINKALIEIPPRFVGKAPIGPLPEGEKQQDLVVEWSAAKGLAEDVRRYGYWMREEAFKRIGHLYPKVKISDEVVAERPDLSAYIGEELTVIAWLWARTVKSPSPAFSHVDVPLVRSFQISSKKNKEAWVQTVVEGDTYSFRVHPGKPPKDFVLGTVARSGGQCLFSGTPIPFKYIREKGKKGELNCKLMAVVAEGKKGRVYISPTDEMESLALEVDDVRSSNMEICHWPGRTNVVEYGLTTFESLFSTRQYFMLSTLSDIAKNIREKVAKDAESIFGRNEQSLSEGGDGARAYGEAISTYLSFLVGQLANHGATVCGWNSANTQMRSIFARQAIPMTWDYAESNPFCSSSGSFNNLYERMVKGFSTLGLGIAGVASQADAAVQEISSGKVVSTDPPYYDNIEYADLSDFFYLWMRRTLRNVFPSEFHTISVPKTEELVANPYRHGSKSDAESFFMGGMAAAIQQLKNKAHPTFPVTIYYAFKQAETKESGTASTGWEVFLEAVLGAGFSITGTWPVRTEKPGRVIGNNSNALASSVVLVCVLRDHASDTITRRQFQSELRQQMPYSLEVMLGGETGQIPIAPVDLTQAAIGPGMAVFSHYEAVLNQDGTQMSVHDALILINRAITDYLSPDSGSFDNDTLFCDSWFSEYGWSTGEFGQANVLAQAKGTTVDGVDEAGVIESGGGDVRLLKWSEYPTDWDPKLDHRTPVWEALHHMIRSLNQQGESGAGGLLSAMPERGESIRQLAYHLYTLCERKGWAEDARAYNELITAWHNIVAASHDVEHAGMQSELEL